MKHLPFEDWLLLGESALTPSQHRALAEHLQECLQCQMLQMGLGEVEDLFRESGLHDPAPGFVERWQARAQQDRLVRQQWRYRWQVGIMLIVILNAVVGLAVFLGGQLFSVFDSWVDVVALAVYRIFALFFALGEMRGLFAVIWRILGGLVPPERWALLFLALGLGSLLWVGWLAHLIKLPRRVGS